jgi:hypothetical protein
MPQNRAQEGVYVWVIRIRGRVQEHAARADRGLARDWVERQLGDKGTWQHGEDIDRYDHETETATIRLVQVPDADALLRVSDRT